MTKVQAKIPETLLPVFMGEADVRGAYGGRGSAKTRTFAKMTAVRAHVWAAAGRNGIILCGRQFMNSLEDSSLEEVKEAIREEAWLTPHFEIGDKYIRHVTGNVHYSFVGLERNISSLKSKARILLAWIDEAEPVSEEAWSKLIPTLREEDSELWITWNPERKRSATNQRFRDNTDERTKIVEINWRQNPWFPDILNRTRLRDKEQRPDQYDHIWEGGYVQQHEGAYYAKPLTMARMEGRIGKVAADPLMTLRAVWDIGGTGAKADATAIWIVQYIGKEIRFVDHYEAVGQPLATHVNWLRNRGHEGALCILPHDGAAHEKVYHTTYEGSLRQAGFAVEVIPNQGAGAAMQRIEAARRLFPNMWFDADRCAGGLEALAWYHEKRNEELGIGQGPSHDHSSHSCLVAGTLVETMRGMVPIEDVRPGDQVRTPVGPANVSWSGETRRVRDLLRITLSDGREIVGTGAHKIFTTRGLVRADALGYSDAIFTEDSMPCLESASALKTGYRAAFSESIAANAIGGGRSAASTSRRRAASSAFSTARRSVSMAWKSFRSTVIRITSIPQTGLLVPAIAGGNILPSTRSRSMPGANITAARTDITHTKLREAPSCIGQSGKPSAGRSLRASMSTTSTGTRPTTASRTSKHSQPPSIPITIQRPAIGSVATGPWLLWQKPRSPQPNGTSQTLAANGIASMAARLWRSVSSILRLAPSAARDTSPSGPSGASFAVGVARVAIISGDPVPVYDLTVDHHHCYFANGVLVSNSDAFGLAAIAYREPKAISAIPYPRRAFT